MFRRRRRSYRPRRYSRRRRSYPSLLRTQMNDSETRTMSFTQNMDLPFTFGPGVQGVCSSLSFGNILSGKTTTPINCDVSSGRIYYAGMMYDRFRVKSCSVRVRPKIMPAATGVPNYTFHIAWDRYFNDYEGTGEESANPRVVTDDPSAKMIIWSPGGNASTLSHYVYSLPKDRYQYVAIDHRTTSWEIDRPQGLSEFLPVLRYVIDLGNEQTTSLSIRLIFQFRFTLEFMGAASIGSGTDYSPIPFKFQSTAEPSASGQPRLVPPT